MITENLSTLKIHKLTQEQYDRELAAGRIDETALYLTPDETSGVDTTLSMPGAPADAKTVGDALKQKQPIGNYLTEDSVFAWAKEETKPSYTAEEVGALSDTTVLADLTDDATHRTVTDTEKQAWNAKSNFSGDYNDLTNAPDISEDGSGDLIIADANGNIIFRSNGNGFETVNLTVENITINGKTIQEMIKEYVDEAILGGSW